MLEGAGNNGASCLAQTTQTPIGERTVHVFHMFLDSDAPLSLGSCLSGSSEPKSSERNGRVKGSDGRT